MTRDDKIDLAFKIAGTALLASMSFGAFFMFLGGIANWPVIGCLGQNMVMGAMFVLGLAMAIMAPVGIWFIPEMMPMLPHPPPSPDFSNAEASQSFQLTTEQSDSSPRSPDHRRG